AATPRHKHERKTPGPDRRDYAIRLGDRQPQMIAARGGDLAADLVRVFGKGTHALGGERYVETHHFLQRPRRADSLHRRQGLDVGFDQLRPAPKHAHTFAWRTPRPIAAAESIPRALDGAVDDAGIGHRQVRVRAG